MLKIPEYFLIWLLTFSSYYNYWIHSHWWGANHDGCEKNRWNFYLYKGCEWKGLRGGFWGMISVLRRRDLALWWGRGKWVHASSRAKDSVATVIWSGGEIWTVFTLWYAFHHWLYFRISVSISLFLLVAFRPCMFLFSTAYNLGDVSIHYRSSCVFPID